MQSKLQQLKQIESQLAVLMAQAEAAHCYCATCKEYRQNGSTGDLCWTGRRTMQTVYAIDVCLDQVRKLVKAKNWRQIVLKW